MSDLAIELTMTRDEAEGCWRRIYAHGQSMQAELVDLYHRKAWLAYDLPNWNAMMKLKAPGKGRATYYNMLSDALSAVEMLEAGDIEPDFATILECLPHAHYEVLKALPDPVARKTAIQLAYATAPDLIKDGKPTATLMQESANVVQEIIDNNGNVELDEGIVAAKAKLVLNHHERVQNHIDKAIVVKSQQPGARKDGPVSIVNLAHAQIRMVNGRMNQITFEFENSDDAQKLIQCYHTGQYSDLIVSVVRKSAKKDLRSLPA